MGKTKSIPCVDHLGNEYSSMTKMLNTYNICSTVFNYRINVMGMSLEEALTSPAKSNLSTAVECTDHLGNTFESKKAMCDFWRIPRTTYFRRIRDGWDEEKALTTPIRTHMKTHLIKDHTGQEYPTIDEMCQQWHISKEQYMINIRNNCSIEEALTTVTEKSICKDHLGNEYSSINDMCRHYGITKHTLRGRIELGWTLKEILENPKKQRNKKPIKDHLGNQYDSINKMLETYGISENVFRHRRKVQHLSLEEALTPGSLHVTKHTDHLGNEFDCLSDMLDYWNLPTSLFHSRIKHYSLKETLTWIPQCRLKSFGPNLTVLKRIDEDFYEVKYKGQIYIWSVDKLFTYYREHKQSETKVMHNNRHIFETSNNDITLYVIAQQTSTGYKKLKHYCKDNGLDINEFNTLKDVTTQDMIDIFHNACAGIYSSEYELLSAKYK